MSQPRRQRPESHTDNGPLSSVPTNLTTWEWLFENEKSVPFTTHSKNEQLGRYINAATAEQLDFKQVKDQATALSTALVRDYGLRPGDTVSVFSTNTVWYPVALWATLRVGEYIPKAPISIPSQGGSRSIAANKPSHRQAVKSTAPPRHTTCRR